jgi:hypothetical protein
MISEKTNKTIFFIGHIDFFHLSQFQHASHELFCGIGRRDSNPHYNSWRIGERP